eukprot:TRINITY_DN13068_c0_g1_i1.p1 TRINITY_DN13068_c0_g1~~TRINITY_DN13068_c0_g1_i1.p1  ORF type:complete len:130 (-),score=47.66 TRINITY_DN13068_c0_g1_i1:116-505(-)
MEFGDFEDEMNNPSGINEDDLAKLSAHLSSMSSSNDQQEYLDTFDPLSQNALPPSMTGSNTNQIVFDDNSYAGMMDNATIYCKIATIIGGVCVIFFALIVLLLLIWIYFVLVDVEDDIGNLKIQIKDVF